MHGRPSEKAGCCTPALPEILYHVTRWSAKAEDDFAAAEQLLNTGTALFSIVAFHAQQCAEKYLKAVLVLESVPFPRTHDLVALRGLVPSARRAGLVALALERLTRYSVEERYPGDAQPVTKEDAAEAVTIAAAVREAARAYMSSSTPPSAA